jgi:DNA-binding CsgD family transcriptional regulator
MSRRREGAVREELSQLETLAAHYAGTGRELRVRMLLIMKQEPTSTLPEVASTLEYSERQVRRWWYTYRTEGLQTLLHGTASSSQSTTVAHSASHPHRAERELSTRMLRFLNSLPTTFNTEHWIRSFRTTLEQMLEGVDRVSLLVNLGSSVDNPEESESMVMVNKHINDSTHGRGGRAMTSQHVQSTPGKTLVAQAAAQGFPVDDYRPPNTFDYYLDDCEYVGTIILWRRRAAPPTPQTTIEHLRSLEPFITFLLSDCVSRRLHSDPDLRWFKDVVEAVANRIGLTRREREIFTLHVMGLTREEIAKRLVRAEGTIGKHLWSIHTKAGTSSYSELFARFYSPLRDD